jgi:hypothetical protein
MPFRPPAITPKGGKPDEGQEDPHQGRRTVGVVPVAQPSTTAWLDADRCTEGGERNEGQEDPHQGWWPILVGQLVHNERPRSGQMPAIALQGNEVSMMKVRKTRVKAGQRSSWAV